jgi:hypothetical protein
MRLCCVGWLGEGGGGSARAVDPKGETLNLQFEKREIAAQNAMVLKFFSTVYHWLFLWSLHRMVDPNNLCTTFLP